MVYFQTIKSKDESKKLIYNQITDLLAMANKEGDSVHGRYMQK